MSFLQARQAGCRASSRCRMPIICSTAPSRRRWPKSRCASRSASLLFAARPGFAHAANISAEHGRKALASPCSTAASATKPSARTTPSSNTIDLARSFGLDPAQMALAYVNSRPFLTSTIIGATKNGASTHRHRLGRRDDLAGAGGRHRRHPPAAPESLPLIGERAPADFAEPIGPPARSSVR